MEIYGIEPSYLSARTKPFIRDERYIRAKSGQRRLAKNQKNRQWFRVGYPKLARDNGRVYYEIWEANGGTTFAEAQAYLDFQLAVFKAQVEFLQKTGKVAH